jgi:hypothetical protein
MKKGHLDPCLGEVFDRLELSPHDIPSMKEDGCLRIKGIEGEDNVYTQLGQLFAEFRIFCQTETIGVHRNPADLRPLATAQKVICDGAPAAQDIDEID